jgi:hypothetical protein
MPETEGQVIQSGRAISNATVVAGSGTSKIPCEAASISTRTDDGGSFKIPSQRELEFIYRPFVDPIRVNIWELCIEHQGQTIFGYRGLNFQTRSDLVVILCDMDKRFPQVRKPSSDEGPVEGACRFVATPNRPMQPTAGSGG